MAFLHNFLDTTPMDQRVYLDENGINQYLYRPYGRSVRGEKVWGEISGRRFSRQSVIAVLSAGKLVSPMCFEGTCDTKLFNIWLDKVLIPNLIPGQVLILDNAGFHKSLETKRLVDAAGCKLMFLPS